jgi:hypothetical protein
MVNNKENKNMVLSIKNFDYHGNLQYSADMSTLDQGGTRKVFHQVYDDACDEGFTVRSETTNYEMDFVVDHEDYAGTGSDREIQGWHLIPTAASARKYPMFKTMKILVVND